MDGDDEFFSGLPTPPMDELEAFWATHADMEILDFSGFFDEFDDEGNLILQQHPSPDNVIILDNQNSSKAPSQKTGVGKDMKTLVAEQYEAAAKIQLDLKTLVAEEYEHGFGINEKRVISKHRDDQHNPIKKNTKVVMQEPNPIKMLEFFPLP